MTPLVAVVVFPGTNCEYDVVEAIALGGGEAELVWHEDESLGEADAVVVPGGFAHGDYLRPGAIARFSPVMEAVRRFAADDGPVLGVCNGFQVLAEAHLLPGALRPNEHMRFICADAPCTVTSRHSVLTHAVAEHTRLVLPINHYQGNFTCDPGLLAQLERNGQIVLRYEDNPNGSIGAVAGVANEAGNVVGLMPHPERASRVELGSDDGLVLLRSFVESAAERRAARLACGLGA